MSGRHSQIVAQLRRASPSFAVMATIAAIGWWVTHTVDRLTASPTIEYTFTQTSGHAGKCDSPCQTTILTAENLSDKRFGQMTLEMTVPGGSIKKGQYIGVGATTGSAASLTVANDDLSIQLTEMQPRAEIQIRADYVPSPKKGPLGGPDVYVQSSADAVLLTKPSIKTFFARHEETILGGAVLLLAAFASVIVTGRFRNAAIVAATGIAAALIASLLF